MLQEVTMEQALKQAAKGKEVIILYDMSTEEERSEFNGETLGSLLRTIEHFLVEVPATKNPDWEEAVQNMTGGVKESTEKEPEKPRRAGRPQKKVKGPQQENTEGQELTAPKQEQEKHWAASNEEAKQIEEMYKAGKSMEEISDTLGVELATVSKFVQLAGLGDERYKGQQIPSSGSAPILTAHALGDGKKVRK